MTVALEEHSLGTILPVKAQPGSRQEGIRGSHDGMLRVSVTQVAEKGKANKSLAAVLSRALDLRKSQIELIAGETSQRKKFLIRDISVHDLTLRIEAALATIGADASE